MPSVQRTSLANEDLVAIALHIAQANPIAANTWLDTIEQKCWLLASMPEMGRLRPELAADLRSWAVGEYVIFYQPTIDGIVVVRVLHGSRDLPSMFTS
jgi:toxin ParE1/3/4